MNFIEAQELVKTMYKDKHVHFQFGMDCVREIDFFLTEGDCNEICHVAYNKVHVYVEGEKVGTWPIDSHRMNFLSKDFREELNKVKIKKIDIEDYDFYGKENLSKEISAMDALCGMGASGIGISGMP